MSKKLLKIIALSAMILSFSANAVDKKSGWSIEAGAGKTFADADNDNKTFYFGTVTKVENGISITKPVLSHIKEFEQEDSYSLFAGLNYNFCNGFVVGAEISYLSHDQKSKNNSNTKLSNESITILAKGKYYFDFGSSIRPFVGGGLGVSIMELDFKDKKNQFSDLERTRFAYMTTAGVAFDASEDISLSLAYVMRGTDDIKSDDDNGKGGLTKFDTLENRVHNIEASIEFKL
jgi:opacity protein-like surface antigen